MEYPFSDTIASFRSSLEANSLRVPFKIICICLSQLLSKNEFTPKTIDQLVNVFLYLKKRIKKM